MPPKKELSLLPEEENTNSFSSKVIRYLTTVGRVIIILTELVVISAFISRFWLDRKNADLSEIIRQQTAILRTTADFEIEYDLLSQRLKTIKELNQNNPYFDQRLSSLVNSTPPEITFNNLTINANTKNTSADFTVIAYKETTIVDYITNLMLNPDIETVEIKKIEKKPKNTQYFVALYLIYKPLSTNGT